MVSKPEQWLEPMAKAGANQFTFHWEAVDADGGDAAVDALIEKVKKAGLKVGLAIKPKTEMPVRAHMLVFMILSPKRREGGEDPEICRSHRHSSHHDCRTRIRRPEVHGRHDGQSS
uniref:Ribulose-phosphate 3-epimerase n=1 Tax=Steinernema glaseri TaxID=37863 RepID=A0A1I8A366_9BILA